MVAFFTKMISYMILRPPFFFGAYDDGKILIHEALQQKEPFFSSLFGEKKKTHFPCLYTIPTTKMMRQPHCATTSTLHTISCCCPIQGNGIQECPLTSITQIELENAFAEKRGGGHELIYTFFKQSIIIIKNLVRKKATVCFMAPRLPSKTCWPGCHRTHKLPWAKNGEDRLGGFFILLLYTTYRQYFLTSEISHGPNYYSSTCWR